MRSTRLVPTMICLLVLGTIAGCDAPRDQGAAGLAVEQFQVTVTSGDKAGYQSLFNEPQSVSAAIDTVFETLQVWLPYHRAMLKAYKMDGFENKPWMSESQVAHGSDTEGYVTIPPFKFPFYLSKVEKGWRFDSQRTFADLPDVVGTCNQIQTASRQLLPKVGQPDTSFDELQQQYLAIIAAGP